MGTVAGVGDGSGSRAQRSAAVGSQQRAGAVLCAAAAVLIASSCAVLHCAGFPHGVFPVSELLCISLLLRIWPRLRIYSICASSTFKVPVWRHILSWTGARPATRHHFRCVGHARSGAHHGRCGCTHPLSI